MAKVDVLATGRLPAKPQGNLEAQFKLHGLDNGAIPKDAGALVRGVARNGHLEISRATLEALPKLEIIANFGVGYDGIDLKAAAERGIIVTNTPDVLTEEVADTTLGLILMTVRELSAAERHLRAGKWLEKAYPLTGTLRDRTAGIIGLGRIGQAVARRLGAMKVPVVYHGRHKVAGVPYRYYADLKAMAADVDLLISVLPGTPATQNIVNAGVLKALGPNGVFINVGRGAVVDEPALIAALKDGTIKAAGLDVFADEPRVPPELIALPNAVLLPHVGSASVHTRDGMGQLVVDNLTSWFEKGAPLTAVPETPWPRK